MTTNEGKIKFMQEDEERDYIWDAYSAANQKGDDKDRLQMISCGYSNDSISHQ